MIIVLADHVYFPAGQKDSVASGCLLQLKHTKMGKPRGLYTARKQVTTRRDNRWVCIYDKALY